MPKTPVDSIVIPARFVALCDGWHSGLDCLLYAVSSTRNLTTGTHRSVGCDSDEKWYLTLWRGLAIDVMIAVCDAAKGINAEDDGGDGNGHDAEYPALVEFEGYADGIVAQLGREYGLEEWDASDD